MKKSTLIVVITFILLLILARCAKAQVPINSTPTNAVAIMVNPVTHVFTGPFSDVAAANGLGGGGPGSQTPITTNVNFNGFNATNMNTNVVTNLFATNITGMNQTNAGVLRVKGVVNFDTTLTISQQEQIVPLGANTALRLWQDQGGGTQDIMTWGSNDVSHILGRITSNGVPLMAAAVISNNLSTPQITMFSGIGGGGTILASNQLQITTSNLNLSEPNSAGMFTAQAIGGTGGGLLVGLGDIGDNFNDTFIIADDGAQAINLHANNGFNFTGGHISGNGAGLNSIPNSATTATSANTPSTIMQRDSSGNVSVNTINGALNGNAATATSATSATSATTATSFSGSLAGDATGTQSATVVGSVAHVTTGTLQIANGGTGNTNATAASVAFSTNTVPGLVAWFSAIRSPQVNNTAISSAPDLSGGGQNAVQATGGSQPTYVTNGINGLPAMQFNGSQWLETPFFIDATYNTNFTVFVVSASSINTGAGKVVVSMSGSGTFGTSMTMAVSQDSYQHNSGLSGPWANLAGMVDETRPAIQTLRRVTNAVETRINGQGTYITVNSTTEGLGAASALFLGAETTNHNNFTGYIGECLVFHGQLTLAQCQTVERYLSDTWHIESPDLVGEGDSLTLGQNSSGGSNYFQLALSALNLRQGLFGVNSGQFAQWAGTMGTNWVERHGYPIRPPKYAIVWAGINDLNNGSGTNGTINSISNLCLTFKRNGTKVMLMSILPATGNPVLETNRLSVNGWERVNWPLIADYFGDVGADPILGFGSNAVFNTTYYAGDATHLTINGYAIVASYATNGLRAMGAVGAFNPAEMQNPITAVTGAYTAMLSDSYIFVTNGGIVSLQDLTLPSMKGKHFHVVNLDGSIVIVTNLMGAQGFNYQGWLAMSNNVRNSKLDVYSDGTNFIGSYDSQSVASFYQGPQGNGLGLTNLQGTNLAGTIPLTNIQASYPQNGTLNMMTNCLLPPWSAQTWQYPPYLDGQLGTFGQSPTVRLGPSNQFLINSEVDNLSNPYMWMGFQCPQYGNSNFVFCVDWCGAANSSATLSIGLSASANPFSGVTVSETSTGIGDWHHLTFTNNIGVNGGTNAVLLLLLVTGNKAVICSNAYIQFQANNAPTNALFQLPAGFTRYDVDGMRVQDNGHTLYSGFTSRGFSAYSKTLFSVDTGNQVVLDLWQDPFVSGIGGIAVLTNGWLYTNITVAASSGTGKEYLANLYLPPGNPEITVVNEYQENSGATAPAYGTILRGIFVDTTSKLKFIDNKTPFTIVVAGDSISEYITDALTSYLDHWSQQFRQSRGVRVIMLSCGYTGMSSETNQNTVMQAIKTYNPNVFIEARIQNDFGLNLTTTNYYGFLLSHELDMVHTYSPGTLCIWWNGLTQTTETGGLGGATLSLYRAQGTNCIITTNRPWCIIEDVQSMPNDTAHKSGLHPTAEGNMWLFKKTDRVIQTLSAQFLNGPFDTGNGWAFNGYVPDNHEFPMMVTATNGFNTPYTFTAGGTTGNQTINKPSGSIRIATSGTSVVLSDSLITANSFVSANIATHDATATSVQAVPSAGSCTFYLNTACTAETEIRWSVVTQ